MKYKEIKHQTDTRPGRMRRRLLVAVLVLGLIFWSGYRYRHNHLPPRELVLSFPPLTSAVTRRYVFFTMPIESGEWPSLYNTKDSLVWAGKKPDVSVDTQIYSNLPRRVAQVQTIASSEFIIAMATDSMHVMAADFYPKAYLKGTQTRLLIMLGPLDPQETETVRKHLDQVGLPATVIRVPLDDLQSRKFELLGTLAEFRKYDQGKAKYYTIIDPDVTIPSLSSFQNLLAQYNSVESHLIVDESFKRGGDSYSPITVTAAFMDRMFERDETWNKCVAASDKMSGSSGLNKIKKCAAIMQGRSEDDAKYDGESLIAREVKGSALGLLENGHQPLAVRPRNVHGPSSGFETDLFQDLIADQYRGINACELLARYAFWENDEVRWVYTHGVGMAHYPNGISDKQLRMTEVTWEREPDETPAHDAPYYRALATDKEKTPYLLHSIKAYSFQRVEWHSIIYRSSTAGDIQVDWVYHVL